MKIRIEVEGEFSSLDEVISALQLKIRKPAAQPVAAPPAAPGPEPKILPKFSKIDFKEYLPEGQTLTQFVVMHLTEAKKTGKDIDDACDECKNLVFGYIRDKRPDFNTGILSNRIRISTAAIKSKFLAGKLAPGTSLDDEGNATMAEVADEEDDEGKVGFNEAGV